MKDFFRVFLLLVAGVALLFGLALLGFVSPFVLIFLRIIVSTGIIVGTILILRKRKEWNHQLPKEKREEYNEWYKNQFKKND